MPQDYQWVAKKSYFYSVKARSDVLPHKVLVHPWYVLTPRPAGGFQLPSIPAIRPLFSRCRENRSREKMEVASHRAAPSRFEKERGLLCGASKSTQRHSRAIAKRNHKG